MRRKTIMVYVLILLLVSLPFILGFSAQKDEGIALLEQLNQPEIKIGVTSDTPE